MGSEMCIRDRTRTSNTKNTIRHNDQIQTERATRRAETRMGESTSGRVGRRPPPEPPPAPKSADTTFGDPLPRKEPGVLRVMSHNINTQPTVTLTSPQQQKARNLVDIITQTDPDGILWQEDNVNWSKLPKNLFPKQKWRQHKQALHAQLGFNTHEAGAQDTRLPGGTSVWTMNRTASFIHGVGVDPKSLGRWCYSRILGKHGRATRLYSAYRLSLIHI